MRRHNSCWCSDSTLTLNFSRLRSRRQELLDRLTQNDTSKGRSETAVKELMARPTAPASVSPATTVTPVVQCPSTVRNRTSSWSIGAPEARAPSREVVPSAEHVQVQGAGIVLRVDL